MARELNRESGSLHAVCPNHQKVAILSMIKTKSSKVLDDRSSCDLMKKIGANLEMKRSVLESYTSMPIWYGVLST